MIDSPLSKSKNSEGEISTTDPIETVMIKIHNPNNDITRLEVGSYSAKR